MRPDTDNYRHLFLHDIPLIDTRAPVEFAKGAFDRAVNLPLMTNEERRQVGICYKEQGQEAAIELGRELVSPQHQEERTQHWLSFAKQHPEGYLYCFRGGLRSRITQRWMASAGVTYPLIQGGYKAMRRYLLSELERLGREQSLILITGRTGTGKTRLLNRVPHSLDLEGMANHRGSSFGSMASPQPTPIHFENRVAVAMLKLEHADATAPVLVEGEGRLVGNLTVPEALWSNMQRSPVLVLEADMEWRVEIGVSDYVVELLARIQRSRPEVDAFEYFAERHRDSLYRIRKRLGLARYQEALMLLEDALVVHRSEGDLTGYRPFIRMLLERYYDPMYDYQLARRQGAVLARGDRDELLQWLQCRRIRIIEE